MTKVLIVEDDSFKLDDLRAFVEGSIKQATITQALDVASAVEELELNVFDLLIIDMALPSHPVISGGGSPLSLLSGGLELLFELRYMQRNDDCIIITQYPEIEISGRFFPVSSGVAAIREHFGIQIVACLEYSESSNEWKYDLEKLLKKYENINS